MKKFKTKEFWLDLAERAISTFCEIMLTYVVVGMPLTDIEWIPALQIAGGATLVSVLKCFVKATKKTDEAEEE